MSSSKLLLENGRTMQILRGSGWGGGGWGEEVGGGACVHENESVWQVVSCFLKMLRGTRLS